MARLTKEIERLQGEQCIKCRYCNKQTISKGPCCTNILGPSIKDGVCYRYVTDGDDPEYICRQCGKMVRVKSVQQSLYALRRCETCYIHVMLEAGEDRLE